MAFGAKDEVEQTNVGSCANVTLGICAKPLARSYNTPAKLRGEAGFYYG